jgi:GNAT superfamily N-acetyltransferase
MIGMTQSLRPELRPLRVKRASIANLKSVRAAYDCARAIQREQHAPIWPDFGDDSILDEIRDGRLYRVSDYGALTGVFTVAYEDGAIWGDLERGAHIYLHRIARSENRPQARLMESVITWALVKCDSMGRDGLRVDTWADNPAIIAYYQTMGFELIGTRRMTTDPRLSVHYHGLELALLELPMASMRQPG